MSQCMQKDLCYCFVGQCLTANRNLHPCDWGTDDESAAVGEAQGHGPSEQQGAAAHQVAEEPGETKGLNPVPLAKVPRQRLMCKCLTQCKDAQYQCQAWQGLLSSDT